MGPSPGSERISLSVSGRYRILRKLGSGGIGAVFLAHDTAVGRRVALKVIRTERLGPKGVEALQREFQAISALRHPQIASAFDFGYTEEGRVPFYTREYIEGEPLAGGPPGPQAQAAPAEFLAPFFDLLEALHYLHAHEILHLDVHAGNLVVARDRRRGSVLIDFGLPLPLAGGGSSGLMSARSFLPPEVLLEAPAGASSDLYSVGRLLLFRLTGSGEGEPRLPCEIPGWGPRLTLELERIAAKALQREPRRRFQSAAEFREALEASLGAKRGAPRPLEPGEITVGREEELKAVEGALREAAAGRAALLWLFGPRGIGKSRLLAEARWRAQLRGLQVAEARFLPWSAGEPALLGALRSLKRKRHRFPRWLAPLAAAHGGTLAERARRAAQAYFASPGSPLAVLLDDYEHADRESRSLAEALLEESAAVAREGRAARGLALFLASGASPSRHVVPTATWPGAVRRLRPLGARDSEALTRTLLRPLRAPRSFIVRMGREARGVPLELRRRARALHAAWGRAGSVPADAPLPPAARDSGGTVNIPGENAAPLWTEVLRSLAAVRRPARVEEMAAATALPARKVRRALRHLEGEDLVTALRRGRERLWQLAGPDLAGALLVAMPQGRARLMHRRLAKHFHKIREPDAERLESLAHHLLAVGRLAAGRRAALLAAGRLREAGLLENATRLLGEAAGLERSPRARLPLLEEASAIHEEAGDHREGIALLEPFLRENPGGLSRGDAVRLRRRLGVHCHRAGMVEEARRLFKEVRGLADPTGDLEELVLVESEELAELHNLHGEHELAEEACRRGLALLSSARELAPGRRGREAAAVRARLEVTLRATMGHLELRRLNLERAREEFEAAEALASTWSTTGLRALILNNLGIVHAQMNDLPRARTCFARARRFLVSSGERRATIQIACNLALIAAKCGEGVEARRLLEEAGQLLLQHPDRRLDYFVGQTRGTVHWYLGDMSHAAQCLREALPLGRQLGDVHMVRFGEVFLGEALFACGQYGEALVLLGRTARAAGEAGPSLLSRMAHSRLWALELLLGRPRRAEASRRELEAAPRSGFELLEAWNDLFAALAVSLLGESPEVLLLGALKVFQRLGVPAGEGFATAGMMRHALHSGAPVAVERAPKAHHLAAAGGHRFLAVLFPLLLAESRFALGELEQAKRHLDEAAGSIVGVPFLELDLWIELLRARIAEREGDREGARSYLHRALYTRDHLGRLVPANLRGRFLSHIRLRPLDEMAARLERPQPVPGVRRAGDGPPALARIIHRSEAMARVVRTIERLRDADLPVIITGETGTGKELVARAIHETGPRKGGPFFALHCAALPPELFEAELFGYEAGAFTGAEETRSGLLHHLRGGTLLLDEVSNLAPPLQAKLLRVLESGSVRPLGSSTARPVDVPFLASSSADLEASLRRQTFRADLYYRLRGVEVHLPPLRARREDIPLLVNHCLRQNSVRLSRTPPVLTSGAHELLREHDWPGNVRELEGVLTRLLLTTSPRASIGAEALEPLLAPSRGEGLFGDDLLAGRSLEGLKRELEQAYLRRLFRETRGDISRMCEALGMKRVSLYIRLRRLGLDVRELRRRL